MTLDGPGIGLAMALIHTLSSPDKPTCGAISKVPAAIRVYQLGILFVGFTADWVRRSLMDLFYHLEKILGVWLPRTVRGRQKSELPVGGFDGGYIGFGSHA